MKNKELPEKSNMGKISKEEYNKIFQGIDLKEIFLVDSHCSFALHLKQVDKNSAEIKIEPEESLKTVIEGEDLICAHELRLVGKISKEKGMIKVFEIACTYASIFKSKEKLTKEFAKEFEKRNLRLFTVPFIREFIENMSMRMCIRPLVLPLYKS